MKKSISLIASMAIGFSLLGCSSQNAKTEDAKASAQETSDKDEASTSEKDQANETTNSENENSDTSTTSTASTPDEHLIAYVEGKEADSTGSFFSSEDKFTERNIIEYALFDLNNDGQNELLMREYTPPLPGHIDFFSAYQYKDGKVEPLHFEYATFDSCSYINTKNQYAGGDTSHANRETYFVSELDENGDSSVVIFFGYFWNDNPEEVPDCYYMWENPTKELFSEVVHLEKDCKKISKEEFKKLEKEYLEENTNIEWKQLD